MDHNLTIFTVSTIGEIVDRKPDSVKRWFHKANPKPQAVWGPPINGKRGAKLYALADLLIFNNLKAGVFDKLVEHDLENRAQVPEASLGCDLQERIALVQTKLNPDQERRLAQVQSEYRRVITDAFEGDAAKLSAAWKSSDLLCLHADILRSIWFADDELPDNWTDWATSFAAAHKDFCCEQNSA